VTEYFFGRLIRFAGAIALRIGVYNTSPVEAARVSHDLWELSK
jgi:hypothetical protein